jgi:hypothetical protein
MMISSEDPENESESGDGESGVDEAAGHGWPSALAMTARALVSAATATDQAFLGWTIIARTD